MLKTLELLNNLIELLLLCLLLSLHCAQYSAKLRSLSRHIGAQGVNQWVE